MTAHQIQDALWCDLGNRGHDSVAPNYTPFRWWECDIFSVTKKGFFVEHEIKLSVSDFRADARKARSHVVRDLLGAPVRDEKNWIKTEMLSKHARLEMNDVNGPSNFYFVVPKDMISVEEIPTWAGLVYAYHPMESGWDETSKLDESRVCLSVQKRAPRLHNSPVNPKVLDHLRKILCWRYWNARMSMRRKEIIADPSFEVVE